MSGKSTRAREALRILSNDGARGLAQRVSRVAYQRLGAAELDFPLLLDDVADSRRLHLTTPAVRPTRGTPLTVGWICTPPGPGSGGHTTMFRMIEAVEAAGHTCVLYLYDRFAGEMSRHEQVIRQYWPRVRAEIRSVTEGLAPLDAYVATAWQTAHVLAVRSHVPTRRLYLVQDFEPFFYPQGSEYALAEDSYRFGFQHLAIGNMCAHLLKEKFNVDAPVAAYGCDTSVYNLTNPGQRSGVVFYAKRDAPRRGYALGVLALHEFHRRHPEQQIHLFGDPTVNVDFPVTNHGQLTTAKLAELYNTARAGIAMSFTNVSLVPAEMIACGVVPVLSGGPYASADLESPYARWADPTPGALADMLSEVVESDSPKPSEIAGSVSTEGWAPGQRVAVATIERAVYGD